MLDNLVHAEQWFIYFRHLRRYTPQLFVRGDGMEDFLAHMLDDVSIGHLVALVWVWFRSLDRFYTLRSNDCRASPAVYHELYLLPFLNGVAQTVERIGGELNQGFHHSRPCPLGGVLARDGLHLDRWFGRGFVPPVFLDLDLEQIELGSSSA